MKEWKSRSRDMLAGISRYYANSFSGQSFLSQCMHDIVYLSLPMFTDADKQVAINLFLGMQTVGVPLTVRPSNRSYVQWYTPAFVNSGSDIEEAERSAFERIQNDDMFWID